MSLTAIGALDAYFRDLALELFPDRDPYRFVFHAMEVFHGTGDFDRQKWSRKDRMKILRQLAQVPALFELNIMIGSVDRMEARKAYLKRNPKMPERTIRSANYTGAFLMAIQCVEYWMEKNRPDEMTMLVSEDAPEIKSVLQDFHQGYINPDAPEEAFKAPHIMDGLQFAKKENALLLQIADHCAFIFKRHIMGKTDVAELYKLLEPRLCTEYKQANGYLLSINPKHVKRIS